MLRALGLIAAKLPKLVKFVNEVSAALPNDGQDVVKAGPESIQADNGDGHSSCLRGIIALGAETGGIP